MAEVVVRTANAEPSENEVRAAVQHLNPDWECDDPMEIGDHEETPLSAVDVPFYDNAARRVVSPDEVVRA